MPYISPLTSAWKDIFVAGWVDRHTNGSDLHGFSDDIGVVANPLKNYQVGPYLIVPVMSDDLDSSAVLLSVVGFKSEKTIDVPLGNPSCAARVYVEDPRHSGPRAALLSCSNGQGAWLLMLT